MAVPAKRPGGVVSSDERSTVMWGVSSPHKNLAILLNPGSCVCFCAARLPRGVLTCYVKIFGAPFHWPGIVGVEAVAVEGTTRYLVASQEGDG